MTQLNVKAKTAFAVRTFLLPAALYPFSPRLA